MYKIVSDWDMNKVAHKVNDLLREGWKIKDRLIVTDEPGHSRRWYTQVLLKEEKAK